MQRQSRRLVVMRHAKAEQVGPSDHQRELAPRGLADAAESGRWLAREGAMPDHALVSAALRTRQTWQAVAEAAGWSIEASFDEGLYAAEPQTALDVIRSVPTDVTSLVVVGHNPTIAYLAQMLDDGEGDAEAVRELSESDYPTSAAAVFELAYDWCDLDVASARLVAFHVGRG